MELEENIGQNGKMGSPKLPVGTRNFIIDIDGVVSEDIPNEEAERIPGAKVIEGSIEQINKWYDEGHVITFFTARTQDLKEATEQWLKANGFKFHNLICGKPRGGNYHYIDDKHIRATTFGKWGKLVKKKVEIEVFE